MNTQKISAYFSVLFKKKVLKIKAKYSMKFYTFYYKLTLTWKNLLLGNVKY